MKKIVVVVSPLDTKVFSSRNGKLTVIDKSAMKVGVPKLVVKRDEDIIAVFNKWEYYYVEGEDESEDEADKELITGDVAEAPTSLEEGGYEPDTDAEDEFMPEKEAEE